jgi:hypothetical protein
MPLSVTLLRQNQNALVWQVSRSAGGLARFAQLGRVLNIVVTLPQIMNQRELESILAHPIREVEFLYARPDVIENNAPQWQQDAFDMMRGVHAANAKFTLRAPRAGWLSTNVRAMLRRMAPGRGFDHVRVRLTDDRRRQSRRPVRSDLEGILPSGTPGELSLCRSRFPGTGGGP